MRCTPCSSSLTVMTLIARSSSPIVFSTSGLTTPRSRSTSMSVSIRTATRLRAVQPIREPRGCRGRTRCRVRGAVAINSRNRPAEISRDFGGEITATAAPLRVTSISSPLCDSVEQLREAPRRVGCAHAGHKPRISDKSDNVFVPCIALRTGIDRRWRKTRVARTAGCSMESRPPSRHGCAAAAPTFTSKRLVAASSSTFQR